LFRKIGIISTMNYLLDLLIIVLNDELLRFKVIKKLLAFCKLYNRYDKKTTPH